MALTRGLGALVILLLAGCPGDGGGVGGGSTGTTGGSDTSPTTTMDGSGTVADTSSGGAMSLDETGGGGMGCCDRHDSPGCDEQAVNECVCTERPECCAFEWSQRCVDLATDDCGATCMPDSGGSTGPVDPTTGTGDSGDSSDSGGLDPSNACCMTTQTPGCPADMMIQDCVCGMDPFCCNQEWDGKCVGIAVGGCGAECDGGGGGPGEGACCMANGTPGCEEPMIQECVCGMDPFCCNKQWDDKCVGVAAGACMACM